MYCTVLLGLQNFLTVYSPRFPAARHAPRFCQLKSKEDSARQNIGLYSLLKRQYDEKSMAFYYIRCCQSSIKKRSFFQIVVVNIKSDSQKWADRMCTYFGMRSAIPDVPPTVDIGRERDFLVLQIISRHSQLILVCGL